MGITECEIAVATRDDVPGILDLQERNLRSNGGALSVPFSRQWFEELVSPSTRNHLWLTNGLSAYSELLWSEHEKGPAAMESQLRDVMVESLTVDTVPIIQSSRLEDYSPELWALTAGKGATPSLPIQRATRTPPGPGNRTPSGLNNAVRPGAGLSGKTRKPSGPAGRSCCW